MSCRIKNPDDPIIWRGPMFNNAINQMMRDADWGDVDYIIVDMPPGTGDAQISLAQNFALSGAVVVTTPQEVALADVRKCMNMLAKVNVPVIGIVENMAGFTAPDGSIFEIFGSGGGKSVADLFSVPLLGSVPIQIDIRTGGDSGVPITAGEKSPARTRFEDIASQVLSRIAAFESTQTKLAIVN